MTPSITRMPIVSLVSLIYITRKSLQKQRSNAHSNITTLTSTLEHRYVSSGEGEALFKDESDRKMKDLQKVSPDLSDSIAGLNMTYQRLIVSRKHVELSMSVSKEIQACADLIVLSGKDTHSKWLSEVCRAFNRVLMQINDEGLAVRELKTLNRVLEECPCKVNLLNDEMESMDKNARFGWRTWMSVRALHHHLSQDDSTPPEKKNE